MIELLGGVSFQAAAILIQSLSPRPGREKIERCLTPKNVIHLLVQKVAAPWSALCRKAGVMLVRIPYKPPLVHGDRTLWREHDGDISSYHF